MFSRRRRPPAGAARSMKDGSTIISETLQSVGIATSMNAPNTTCSAMKRWFCDRDGPHIESGRAATLYAGSRRVNMAS
jgi:hypothetical protein